MFFNIVSFLISDVQRILQPIRRNILAIGKMYRFLMGRSWGVCVGSRSISKNVQRILCMKESICAQLARCGIGRRYQMNFTTLGHQFHDLAILFNIFSGCYFATF